MSKRKAKKRIVVLSYYEERKPLSRCANIVIILIIKRNVCLPSQASIHEHTYEKLERNNESKQKHTLLSQARCVHNQNEILNKDCTPTRN